MKKIIYLMSTILLVAMLYACDDKDDVDYKSNLEKHYFSIENSTYRDGSLPSPTTTEKLEGVEISGSATSGNTSTITVTTTHRVSKFFVGVKGVPGYLEYIPSISAVTRCDEDFITYDIPLCMSEEYDEDITIIISGQFENGDITDPVEGTILYIEDFPKDYKLSSISATVGTYGPISLLNVTYDKMGRFLEINYANVNIYEFIYEGENTYPTKISIYEYDEYGNLDEVDVVDQIKFNKNGYISSLNMDGETAKFTYDNAGHLINANGTSFTWENGNLISIIDADSYVYYGVSYTYSSLDNINGQWDPMIFGRTGFGLWIMTGWFGKAPVKYVSKMVIKNVHDGVGDQDSCRVSYNLDSNGLINTATYNESHSESTITYNCTFKYIQVE